MGCCQRMDPPQEAAPEDEKAPETHENNLQKEQLGRVCQGDKKTAPHVASEDSSVTRGGIAGRQSRTSQRQGGTSRSEAAVQCSCLSPATAFTC